MTVTKTVYEIRDTDERLLGWSGSQDAADHAAAIATADGGRRSVWLAEYDADRHDHADQIT
jgi:hypothetical protein